MRRLEPQDYQWVRHIRYLRDRMCLTQQQFGERLEVSGQTVYRWEAGRTVPSLKVRNSIIQMLTTEGRQGQGPFDFHLLLKSAVVEISSDSRTASIIQHRTLVANVEVGQYLWEFYSEGPLKVLEATPGSIAGEYHRGLKTYTIHDLGRKLTPGESVDVALKMEAEDTFPSDTEWHGLEVSEPIDLLSMRVRFSPRRRPTAFTADILDAGRSIDATASVVEAEVNDWYELGWDAKDPALFSSYTLRWKW